MTSNRDMKRAARELAKQKNISYTAALRELAQRHIHEISAESKFLELLGIHNSDRPASWKPMSEADARRLRIPIGFDPQGHPLWLDLKGAGGDGPHGLATGMTGAGKSVFFRTVLLAVCSMFSPDSVNVLCVDWKGGAAYQPFKGLPHVAAVITDLQDDPRRIDALRATLLGDLTRRTDILHELGFKDVDQYERAREQGLVHGPRIPTLLIVVEDLHELLGDFPDALDMFVSVARVGEALGMHMLLGAQRLDARTLDVLVPHLSYRLALPTVRGELTRMGVPSDIDVSPIPFWPGRGALLTSGGWTQCQVVDTGKSIPTLTRRIRAAVAANPNPADAVVDLRALLADGLTEPGGTEIYPPATELYAAFASVGHGKPGPYPVRIGSRADHSRPAVLDIRPRARGGIGPHGLITGEAESGKTELLRTITANMLNTHAGADAFFLILDSSGGDGTEFAAFADFSNVFMVVNRSIKVSLADLLDRMWVSARRHALVEQAHANADDYELARRRGEHDGPPMQPFVIVIDGTSILEEQPELTEVLETIAREGEALNIYLLIATRTVTASIVGLEKYLTFHIECSSRGLAELSTGAAMREPIQVDLTTNEHIASLDKRRRTL